jgi:cell division transport system ATP-binding protein
MKKTMVEMIKVTKVYAPDIVALEEISVEVENGQIVFLIGMSGAGKTTLLKLICGIELPTTGFIEVAGKNLNNLRSREIPALRQQIGMAYQDFKLLDDRTAAQNIAMSMEVTYTPSSTIKRRIKDLLQRLKLENKHDMQVSKLSRGEQQRVAIARAVASSPGLILADEPTGNLDAASTELVMNLLEECNAAGATIILATHDESIFRNTSHTVLKLHHGQLLGPVAPVISQEIEEP